MKVYGISFRAIWDGSFPCTYLSIPPHESAINN
jgi:hypothetical protein